MSRKEIKAKIAHLVAENRQYGRQLVPVPLDPRTTPSNILAVWRSNRFLVQLYRRTDGGQRLTVSRTMIDPDTGRWVDGITWDELQAVKRAVGLGERWAVEVYPADTHIVNVSAMRHLFLLDDAPDFAWRNKAAAEAAA